MAARPAFPSRKVDFVGSSTWLIETVQIGRECLIADDNKTQHKTDPKDLFAKKLRFNDANCFRE